jgi:hypothetical protein
MHEDLAARLEARIRDGGFQDRIGYTSAEMSARVAQLATLLGLDALEATRGDKTLEQLEDQRDGSARVNEEVNRVRKRLDPSDDAFLTPESAEGDR